GWMRPLAFWPGPMLAAAIVLPWMIAIGVATQGQFFAEAIGGDLAPKLAGGAEGHAAPPGYHLLLLPLLIFPATLALPQAARLGWRVLRAARTEAALAGARFCLAWAGPAFLVFELLPTKLAHYTLPAYPALALLAAAGFEAARRERWRIASGLGLLLFALVGAAFVALCAYAARYMPGDAAADARRMLQGALAGAAMFAPALLLIALAGSPALRIGAAILVALTISFVLRERLLPQARTLLVSHEAAAALTRAGLNPRLAPDAPPLWLVGYGETSLVFETSAAARVATPQAAGADALPGQTLVVEGRAAPALTQALAARGLAPAPVGAPITGLNYGNGDAVSLQIARVATAAAATEN
ncbi:MAG: glycosyltransferase family 39 protein, partial [Hyphomonadaceae bacterium]